MLENNSLIDFSKKRDVVIESNHTKTVRKELINITCINCDNLHYKTASESKSENFSQSFFKISMPRN